MSLPAVFSLHRSEFGAFLAAEIWQEDNGHTLSVLSALARLELDPWGEAARLNGLSREAAALALGAILCRLPDNRRTRREMAAITTRLVQTLPAPTVARSGTVGDTARPASGRITLVWIGLALAAAVIGMAGGGWLF